MFMSKYVHFPLLHAFVFNISEIVNLEIWQLSAKFAALLPVVVWLFVVQTCSTLFYLFIFPCGNAQCLYQAESISVIYLSPVRTCMFTGITLSMSFYKKKLIACVKPGSNVYCFRLATSGHVHLSYRMETKCTVRVCVSQGQVLMSKYRARVGILTFTWSNST